MKKLITTVGTSLFSNYQKRKDDITSHLDYIKEKESRDYESCKRRIEQIKVAILKDTPPDPKSRSAEIKSILEISKEIQSFLETQLLASDSLSSVVAAEIIEKIFSTSLSNENIKVSFQKEEHTVEGLQVKNKNDFEKKGMPELIAKIENFFGGYYENCLLNITGGFKATIPYLTIFGQINNLPLYYIFEETTELIKIPQAPIDISWGIFEKYAHVFRDLEKGISENWEDYKRKIAIEDDFRSCIWEDTDNKGMAELNIIGKIFWERYKKTISVYILRESDYFKGKAGDKNELNVAFQELYKRLNNYIFANNFQALSEKELYQKIRSLGSEDDLNHGGSINIEEGRFLFKSTNKNQIRLVYSFQFRNKEFQSLKIFDYKQGGANFDHSKYILEFKKKYSSIPNPDFTLIPILKEV
jgi:CRISPR/Cas system-associated protein Csm6